MKPHLVLLMLLFSLIPLLLSHPRNYFLLSDPESSICKANCEALKGHVCVNDYQVPEHQEDVNIDEKYSITAICCDRPCSEGLEEDIEKLLPHCEGEYLDFDYLKWNYRTKFPRCSSYSTGTEELFKVFPHLASVNHVDNPRIEKIRQNPNENDIFFILKSTNDDDIHKAIKYQIWTSTNQDNFLLSKSYKEAVKNDADVVIFFKVESVDCFIGAAVMTGDFEQGSSFKYWWEGCKWFGSFKIEWLFIKDVPTTFYSPPRISDRNYHKIMQNFKGYQLFDNFCTYVNQNSIFNAFTYMDTREDILRFDRDNDSIFLANFYEFSKMYNVDPWSLMHRKDDKYWENKKKKNRGIFYEPLEEEKKFKGRPFYPKANEEPFYPKAKEEKNNFDFKPFYPSNYENGKQ